MTILRKLALAIAVMVQRFASPSAQEWAQATHRELQFISSDWAAFFWAIGSIRILFKRTARPLADFADIPRAARDLRRKLQWRTFSGYAVTFIEAAWFAWCALFSQHPLQKAGCALTAAAMLVWACQLFSRRPSGLPKEDAGCAKSYRSELERQRDFFRGGWLWLRLSVVVPGVTLLCLDGLVFNPGETPAFEGIAGTFAVLLLIGIRNSRRIASNFQKQLDDLDGVLREPR